jgi:hypothetical protein
MSHAGDVRIAHPQDFNPRRQDSGRVLPAGCCRLDENRILLSGEGNSLTHRALLSCTMFCTIRATSAVLCVTPEAARAGAEVTARTPCRQDSAPSVRFGLPFA